MTNKIKIIFFALALGFGASVVQAAWSNPSLTPPDCPEGNPGCHAPVHPGSGGQIKEGGLSVGAGLSENDLGFSVVGGKAGIGTDEPTQMLDVTGYSKSRTGFCIDDDCIESWDGGGDTEITSGTIVAAFNLTSCPAGWSPFGAANGKMIIGANAPSYPVNSTGGNASVVVTPPSHSHNVNGAYSSWINYLGSQSKNFCTESDCGNSSYIITNGQFTGINVSSTGGNQPLNIMNPYIPLTYCSKDLP